MAVNSRFIQSLSELRSLDTQKVLTLMSLECSSFHVQSNGGFADQYQKGLVATRPTASMHTVLYLNFQSNSIFWILTFTQFWIFMAQIISDFDVKL